MKNASRAGRARRLRWGAIGLLVWALVACGSGGGSGTDSASDPGTVAQVREEWIGPELDPVAVLDCPIPSRDGPPGVACYADVTTWLPQSVRSDGAGGVVLAVHEQTNSSTFRLARVNAAGERRTLPEVSFNGDFDVAPDGTVWMLRHDAIDTATAPGVLSGDILTLSPGGRLSVFSRFESPGPVRPPGEGELSPTNLGAVTGLVAGPGVLYVGSRLRESQSSGSPLDRNMRWAVVTLGSASPSVKALPAIPAVPLATLNSGGVTVPGLTFSRVADSAVMDGAAGLWLVRDVLVSETALGKLHAYRVQRQIYRWLANTTQWSLALLQDRDLSQMFGGTGRSWSTDMKGLARMPDGRLAWAGPWASDLMTWQPGGTPQAQWPRTGRSSVLWGADGADTDVVVPGVASPVAMPDGAVVFHDPVGHRLRRWQAGQIRTWSGPQADTQAASGQWRSARLVGGLAHSLWYVPMADVPQRAYPATGDALLADRLQPQALMQAQLHTGTSRWAGTLVNSAWQATAPVLDGTGCTALLSELCLPAVGPDRATVYAATAERVPRLLYVAHTTAGVPQLWVVQPADGAALLADLGTLPACCRLLQATQIQANSRHAVFLTQWNGVGPSLLVRVELASGRLQVLAQTRADGHPATGLEPLPEIPPERGIVVQGWEWGQPKIEMAEPGAGQDTWLASTQKVWYLGANGVFSGAIGANNLSNPRPPAQDGLGQEARFGHITRIRSLPTGGCWWWIGPPMPCAWSRLKGRSAPFTAR